MKQIQFLAILSIFLLASCAPKDKQARLQKLERQRDSLNQQIEKLRTDIAGEGGSEIKNERIVYVAIQQVNLSLFKHFIKVQGTVESDNNILIPAQTSGLVEKIHVAEGNTVSRGQLLAELDGAILERSIAEVENSLDLAQTIFERQERLWKKNIGSEIDYLRAKNNKGNLEKKLETLHEQHKLTKITSPISGTVDNIMIKEGEMAAAGRGTIRIVQLSQLKITASVSENYISHVHSNDIVHVAVPVIGREYDLTIDAVSQVIDPDNRTFEIEISIPSKEKDLKPNMLSVVTINDYSNPQALVVPQNIIQKTGTQKFMFAALEKDGQWTAQKRIIQAGIDNGDTIEVKEGIEEGDFIITFGFQNLADGQRISVEKIE
ncbi:efflux RND transporter periplasmic adaptor subunit [Acidobacteriota bacterium]